MLNKLKTANKLLKSGIFSEALNIYQEIKQESEFYASLVSFNIDLCAKSLTKKNKGQCDFDFIKLLKNNIGNKFIELEYKDYQNIKNVILKGEAKPEELASICTAICASPFQIDLYRLLLKFIQFDQSKIDNFSNSESFTYLDILNCCRSSAGWLSGRKKLKEFLQKNNNSDVRAQSLLLNDPSRKLAVENNLFLKNERALNKNNIAFGTILLNEEKFIFSNLLQHYEFCDQWILVEGACIGYPERKVSKEGLSLDKTSELIKCFPDPDGKVLYVRHGWTKNDGENAKSELRNRYLEYSNSNYLVVIDADEFYLKEDLEKGLNQLTNQDIYSVTLPQVHFWKNLKQFITGAYYDISHTRIFKNIRGMKYIKNHNFPEINGKFLTDMGHFKFKRTIENLDNGKCSYKEPKCHHMGFAKDEDDMKDKSDYYINRGEMKTRTLTTQSRTAWFDNNLPENCKVREWGGNIPTALS